MILGLGPGSCEIATMTACVAWRLTFVDSAGLSSHPWDMMPWKRKMAFHCGRKERRRLMSSATVRLDAASSRFEASVTPAGCGGVCRSVSTTLLVPSLRSLAASIGPRKPAPPVMRMLFMVLIPLAKIECLLVSEVIESSVSEKVLRVRLTFIYSTTDILLVS